MRNPHQTSHHRVPRRKFLHFSHWGPQGSRHCASRQQPSQATEAAPQAALGSWVSREVVRILGYLRYRYLR